ncbi:ATP-binding protein [Herbaspirillum sp. SJZ107]|uniref:hybrid sensor histidine kinase/response regulator n=1 Tax=Herbaspirillum sp. SJZ107 TaxID=2572881 RepID=UPI0011543058|nr:ATP-binding protein [Herbaspirillum sp. SJZ107]TQK07954.1 phospho-acceptor domain-containing protein [Herbaspirillum sp. SJZ107]
MRHIDDEPCTLAADSFELLARLCPDGVLIIVDDRIVYACPAADTILSPAAPGGLPGRAPLSLVLPAHHARVRERWAQAAAGAFLAPEEIGLCGVGGRCFDAELSCGPFVWHGRPALQMLVRDISERKAMLTQLHATESRLAAELEEMTRLHQLSSRLLATRDLSSALDEVLDAAIALLGADFGNIQLYNPQKKGLEIVVQRGFPQAFLDTFRLVRIDNDSACARALRSGEAVIVEDVLLDPSYAAFRAIAAQCGYRAVHSIPLRIPGGEMLGMLSTCFRAPHRASTHQLRVLELYGRQAVDLIDRLRAEQALRDADRRKDEFLATLAHELRNPLAPISNAMILLRPNGDQRRRADHLIGMVQRQVRHIVRLVDDLLEVSRITRGKIELRRAPALLADILHAALETSRPLIDQAGHRLHADLPDEPLVLDADSVRLTQVFSNLLNNAAKYTLPGGDITLAARRDGAEAEVSVRDNGIGIPTAMLGRVFDIFVQGDENGNGSNGGLGIGLTMARSLVELHAGRIEARSDGPGLGSEFVVRLPLLLRTPADGPAADVECAPLSGRRLLIVDDNRDAADSLALLLSSSGAEVRVGYGAEEALAAIAGWAPDAAIIDLGMPGIDGCQLAGMLRADLRYRGMLLVALTGWGQRADRERSRACGFDAHLTKPAEIAALTACLAADGSAARG